MTEYRDPRVDSGPDLPGAVELYKAIARLTDAEVCAVAEVWAFGPSDLGVDMRLLLLEARGYLRPYR